VYIHSFFFNYTNYILINSKQEATCFFLPICVYFINCIQLKIFVRTHNKFLSIKKPVNIKPLRKITFHRKISESAFMSRAYFQVISFNSSRKRSLLLYIYIYIYIYICMYVYFSHSCNFSSLYFHQKFARIIAIAKKYDTEIKVNSFLISSSIPLFLFDSRSNVSVH